MAFKRQTRLFACFEEDAVGLRLDLGVIFVMLFDDIDGLVPILRIRGSSRETRNHVEACIDAHVCVLGRCEGRVKMAEVREGHTLSCEVGNVFRSLLILTPCVTTPNFNPLAAVGLLHFVSVGLLHFVPTPPHRTFALV